MGSPFRGRLSVPAQILPLRPAYRDHTHRTVTFPRSRHAPTGRDTKTHRPRTLAKSLVSQYSAEGKEKVKSTAATGKRDDGDATGVAPRGRQAGGTGPAAPRARTTPRGPRPPRGRCAAAGSGTPGTALPHPLPALAPGQRPRRGEPGGVRRAGGPLRPAGVGALLAHPARQPHLRRDVGRPGARLAAHAAAAQRLRRPADRARRPE